MELSKLSETSRGYQWLKNFAADEQDAAKLLVDSLYYASSEEVRIGISETLSMLAGDLNPGKSILYPVLGNEDIDRIVQGDDRKNWKNIAHVAYETFDPSMDLPVTSGSEAIIGNIIRDHAGENAPKSLPPGRNRWIHPGVDFDQLRGWRCQNIMLITDYSSSGSQVLDSARTFAKNTTFRSWRSFGRCKIHVLAFAASAEAINNIQNDPNVDNLHVYMPTPSFSSAGWTKEERIEVEKLCRDYARLPGRNGSINKRISKQALGYKDSGGLLFTATTVPNNLPFVLRRSGNGWNSLFEGRGFPEDLRKQLLSYRRAPADRESIALQRNERRMAEAVRSGRLRSPADDLSIVLSLLNSNVDDPSEISQILAKTSKEVSDLLDFLSHVGFVDASGSITALGQQELKHARWRMRRVTAGRVGASSPYYPTMLR